MKLSIDKSLPLSLQSQIVGAIEYGILSGIFRYETPLPSVRALSKQLGVAPLTVSNAYQELKKKGLIETVTGKGTYVSRQPIESPKETGIEALRQQFQRLLQEAQLLGLNTSFFIGMLNHDSAPGKAGKRLKVAIVGNSDHSNQLYIDVISQVLPQQQKIDSYTFSEFDALEQGRVDEYDLFMTLPHCDARIQQRVSDETPILTPALIPSEQTRMQLAALPAETPVLLVSHYQTLLPAMVEGIKRFAPHLGELSLLAMNNLKPCSSTSSQQVIIYSPGCYQKIQQAGLSNTAFEYRHTPDLRYLKEVLYPEYERCLERLQSK
ncbi:MAG: GntR family transcriptional regulator [Enterobacteriaceae bacterium]